MRHQAAAPQPGFELKGFPLESTLIVIPHYGPDPLVYGLFASMGFRLPAGGISGQVTLIEQPRYSFLIINNNSQNRGFTAACNVGLKRLLELPPALRYAWLLQNDTEFESRAQFEHALEVLQRCARERDWAITAQQVRRSDLKDEIIFGGALDCFPEPRHKSGLCSRAEWKIPSEERWLSFRSALVRRDLPERIGLMDSGLATYYADSDYCLLARESGFTVGYTGAESFIFHQGDLAAAPDPERQKTRYQDNLSFWRKWIGGPRHTVYLRLMAGSVPDAAFSVGTILERARAYPELHSWLATLAADQQISIRDITEHFLHQRPPSSFTVLCNLTREMIGGF